MSRRSSFAGDSRFTLVDIANLFYQNNYNESLRNHDPSIYSFPKLDRQVVTKLTAMIKSQTRFLDCCEFLGPYFVFDPAYVSGCGDAQFSAEECHVGILAGFLALAGNKEYLTGDFVSVLTHSIICTLEREVDARLLFCLHGAIYVLAVHGFSGFGKEHLHEICDFFASHGEFGEVGVRIMSCLLNICFRSRDSEDAGYVERALGRMLMLDSRGLSELNLGDIMMLCVHKLESLDFDTISLLATISDIQPGSDILSMFARLAEVVIVKMEGAHGVAKEMTETSKFNGSRISLPYEFEINADTFADFPMEISPFPQDIFDSALNTCDLLSEQQFSILNMFQPLLHRKHHEVTLNFLSVYAEELKKRYESECFVELYVFFVSILESLSDIALPNNVIDSLLESPVFSRNFILFYAMDKFDVMNALRNMSLSVILNNWPEHVESIFKKVENDVFLLIEIVGRLGNLTSYSSMAAFLTPETIRIISAAASLLVYMINGNSDTMIKSAYSTLVTFLVSVADAPESSTQVFRSVHFVNILLGHVFHPELRKSVLSTLSKFLMVTTCPVALANISSFFCDVFHTSRQTNVVVASELLTCIVDSLTHHQEIVDYVAPAISPILSYFLYCPVKESMNSIVSLLLLMASSGSEFHLTYTQMKQLGASIEQMEPDGLCSSTLSMVLALLAGSKSATISSAFVIKNPSFIVLLMNVMSSTIPDMLEFFARLCEYSVFNCIQCHVGEVDLFLIALLKAYPNKFTFREREFSCDSTREDTVEIALRLLAKIFTYRASPCAIERLLSLTIPDEHGVYPANASTILSSMVDLCTKLPTMPQIYHVSTPQADPIEGKATIGPGDGYTLTCEILVDIPIATGSRASPIIAKLSDAKDVSITVFILGGSIQCEISSANAKSSATLCSTLPSCQWILLSMVFKPWKDDEMYINFGINKNQNNLFTVADPHLDTSSIKVTIGGSHEECCQGTPFLLIGKCQLFDSAFTSKMIEAIFVNEMTELKDKIEDIRPESDNGYIQSFNQVLSQYELDSIFVPFFKLSEGAPPHFLENIVDLLRLSTNRKIYSVIAHYLTNSPLLSYSLYLRFFSLFSVNPSLELFENIIFNFELWASAKSIRRVVNHWSSVLFPTFPSFVVENTTFSDIVSSVRLFFYFSKDDVDFAEQRNFDIAELPVCRTQLNRLLYQYAEQKLEDQDVLCLLSHIFSSNDCEQKIAFLSLLCEISVFVKDKESVALQLHPLFLTTNMKVFAWALRCVLKLSSSDQINLVICHLAVLKLNYEFLQEINNVCLEGFCEAFPLAGKIASQIGLGETVIQSMCSVKWDKEMSQRIRRTKYWFAYLFLAAYQTENMGLVQDFVMIITKIVFDQEPFKITYFGKMFAFLDLMDLHFDVNSMKLKGPMFILLSKYGIEHPEFAEDILGCCARYLCFTFQSQLHSSALLHAYHDSPFMDPNVDKIEDKKYPVYPFTFRNDVDNSKLVFHLNYDESGGVDYTVLMTTIFELHSLITHKGHKLDVYVEYLHAIAAKKTQPPAELFERNLRLVSRIKKEMKQMSPALNTTFSKTVDKLKAHLVSGAKRADELLSIQDDIFELSNDSMHKNKINRTLTQCNNKNFCAQFESQYLTDCTIWRHFSYQPRFKRLLRATSSCLSNRITIDVAKVESQMRHKIVGVSSEFHQFRAHLIKFNKKKKCQFVVTSREIIVACSSKFFSINIHEIRTVLLKPMWKIEITTQRDRAFLFELAQADFETLLVDLRTYITDPHTLVQTSTDYVSLVHQLGITKRWVERRLSNFEYLLQLNFFGGRSYLDPEIYPIMPFIRDFNRESGYLVNPSLWMVMFDCFRPYFNEESSMDFHEIMDSRKYELIPEFFSVPECFVNIEKDPFTFVYELRELLESDLVSQRLNEWIDHVFGTKQKEIIETPTLFNEPHPERMDYEKPTLGSRVIVQIDACDIAFCSMRVESGDVILGLLTNSGYHEFSANFETMQFQRLKTLEMNTELYIPSRSRDGIVLYNTLESRLNVIKNGEVAIDKRIHSWRAEFAGPGVSFGSTEGNVFCVDPVTGDVFGRCHVSDQIVRCVASSAAHQLTVAGTDDGMLLYFDRTSGKFVRGVSLDGRIPNKLLITRGWGFVVVECQGFIVVYSVNGMKVGETAIDFECRCSTTWQSSKGFDYIAFCDNFGQIRAAEVFRIGEMQKVCSFKMVIAGIMWSPKDNGVIIVFRNGKVAFYPYLFV